MTCVRVCILALLSLGTGLVASEANHSDAASLVLSSPVPLARPGLPLPIDVVVTGANTDPRMGPIAIALTIQRAGEPLLQQRLVVEQLAQLHSGVRFHPVLPAQRGPGAIVASAELSLPDRTATLQTSYTWRSSDDLLDTLARALTNEIQSHQEPASLRNTYLSLIAEQLALTAQRAQPLSVWNQWKDLLDRGRWSPLGPAGWTTEAWRDPVDNGVIPFRWQPALADGEHAVAVICREPAKSLTKLDWPAQAAGLTDLLTATGCRVVEWYPAGDEQWRGIAADRLSRWLGEQTPGPTVLIGIGHGANGALSAAAKHPDSRVLLIDPRLGPALVAPTSEPAAIWQPDPGLATVPLLVHGTPNSTATRRLPELRKLMHELAPATTLDFETLSQLVRPLPEQQERRTPPATAPPTDLLSYADKPFQIILGDSGSLAGQERNRRNAENLLQAWVTHAHSAPRWATASSLDPAAVLAGNDHLILLGDPSTNSVIAALAASQTRLPLTWDHRSIQLGANDDGPTVVRAGRWAAVAAWPDPAQPDRLLVIIDGHLPTDAHPPGQLPLSGLPTAGLRSAEGGWQTAPLHRWWGSADPASESNDEP